MKHSNEKREIDWGCKTDNAMFAAVDLSEKVMADDSVGRAEFRRSVYPNGSMYYEFWTYPTSEEEGE